MYHESVDHHSVLSRSSSYNWKDISGALNHDGYAILNGFLNQHECAEITNLHQEEAHFRSRVHMARHGFGKGEYGYFRYPLPDLIDQSRHALYPYLAKIANEWNEKLGIEARYPLEHHVFIEKCWENNQKRPTPLLLSYGPGDYNCLHQDLCGDLFFPLQVVVLLSAPGDAFTGGELILTEQRPRMQSRVEVISLQKGDAAIFPVHSRPVRGLKGLYRVTLKHGVSRIKTGQRYTLGLIFHDAL